MAVRSRQLSLAMAGLLCLAACVAPMVAPVTPSVTLSATTKRLKRQCFRPGVGKTPPSSERPQATNQLSSVRYPITVHWSAPTTEAYARKVLGYMEAAWREQVEVRGWPRPLPDRGRGGSDNLDVYLEALGAGQAYVAEEDLLTTPFAVATCYVGFDRQLPDDGTLESYAMHEFNHTCQYALDLLEGNAFYEHTAAFMDRLLVPDNPANKTGIADFQATPWRSLDAISGDTADDEYEYGAALFQTFLSERYAGTSDKLVQQLWRAGQQPDPGRGGDRNEPDWIDVLPATLARFNGPSLETALTEFGSWRLTESLKQARRFPMPALSFDDAQPERFAPSAAMRPGPWGMNYLRLAPKDGSYRVTLSASGASRWVLWAGTTDRVGKWLATAVSEPAASPQLVLPQGGLTTYVMVLNLGAGAHDPDRRQWQPQGYRLDFAAQR